MTIKGLVSKIAKLEGKKHQTSVGDVREIIGIISDTVYNGDIEGFWKIFYDNGKRRAKRKKG